MKNALFSYEEALEKVIAQCPKPKPVRLPLSQCLGRVLASPVLADVNVPPFNRSSMDGYALRSEDVREAPVQLRLVGVVGAGEASLPSVSPGTTARIMTGAPVPPESDAVQMVEESRMIDSATVEILKPASVGANISLLGSEVSKGSVVLEAGRLIGASEIGVLATFGQSRPEIYSPLRVAVISTGDELVSVETVPEFGEIRNSNGPMISALCRRLGLEVKTEAWVGDDPEQTAKVIQAGLEHDLVLVSGGVSMGEYDFVHRVLERVGVDLLFHKVAVKPGKPICVGRKGNALVFGLPGNPVSAFVTFQLFVGPLVRQRMGFQRVRLRRVEATLTRSVSHKPGRTFFKPAITELGGEIQVSPVETEGSADLTAFAKANSLLIVPPEVSVLNPGMQVPVLLLEDFLERMSDG